MQRKYRLWPLLLLYGLVTMLFMLLLLRQQKQAAEAGRLVTYTQAVLEQSSRLEVLCQQDLAAFRGYLLIGDERLLQEHRQTQTAIRIHLATLDHLTQNPQTRTQLARLRQLIQTRESFTRQVGALYAAGNKAEALLILRSRYFTHVYRGLTQTTSQIRQMQTRLYRERVAGLQHTTRVLDGLLWVAMALLLAAAIVVVRRTRHSQRLRQKLEHDQQQFSQVFNSLSSGLLVMDLAGTVQEWNDKAGEICGFTRTEMLGKKAGSLLQVQYISKTEAECRAELETCGMSQAVVAARHKDGRTIHHSSILSTRQSPEGIPDGVIVVFQDFSSFVQEKEQLATAVGELNQTLDTSARKYEVLVESITDSVYSVDGHWNILYLNGVACALNSTTPEAATGARLWDVWGWIHMEQYPQLEQTLRNCMLRQVAGTADVDFREINAFYRLTCYPSKGGLTLIFKDVTEQKKITGHNEQLQAQLMAEKEQYATLVQSVSDGVYALDRHWCFTYANPVICGYFGVQFADMIGRDFREFWPNLRSDAFRDLYALMEAGITQGTDGYLEVAGEDGIHSYGIRIYPSGKGISVIYTDVTGKWAQERERQQMAEEITRLNHHLQQVRENERLELAREIHDELGQQLTGVKISLSLLLRKAQRHTDVLRADAAECLAQMDESIQSVRRIATHLRPPMLDDLGLLQAMEWHARSFEKRQGTAISFVANGVPSIPGTRAIHLFRIFQESLTNIARHAKATRVQVQLSCDNNKLVLAITDNGQGLPAQQRTGALGITGMQERARILAGSFHIANNPGGGTTVWVQCPLGITTPHA